MTQHKESQQFSEDMVMVLQKCEAEKKILELLNETLAYQLRIEKTGHEHCITTLSSCESDHEVLVSETEELRTELRNAESGVSHMLSSLNFPD